MLKIIEASLAYENQIADFRAMFLNSGEGMNGTNGLRNFASPAKWVEHTQALKEGKIAELAPSTTFLAVRRTDDKLIGIGDVRHFLTPYLAEFGGHIGYCIYPDEREKGYGKAFLGSLIAVGKERGLDKILLICEKSNLPSGKIIEDHGGVRLSEYIAPDDKSINVRYQVTI